MSKNAEGWIRHRGGKCPVKVGVKVDYRMRNGRLGINERSELLDWARSDESPKSDIMAYRLHKPVEQVDGGIYAADDSVSTEQVAVSYIGESVQGPLQWRDRITTIDFDIHSLTAERADLVQKLASEGFALIGRINDLLTDAAQKHEDMSDWRNWKEGDLLEMVKASEWEGMTNGKLYKFAAPKNRDNFAVIDDDGELRSFSIGLNNSVSCDFKWHSRPSA